MTIKLVNETEFDTICIDGAAENQLILHLANASLAEVADEFHADNLTTIQCYENTERQAVYTGYTLPEYICKDGDVILIRLVRQSLSRTINQLQEELTATRNEVAALTTQIHELKTKES